MKKTTIERSYQIFIIEKNHNPKTIQQRRFSIQEDEKLREIINSTENIDWESISKLMSNRNPIQCKERWENYLNSKINKLPWTNEEDQKSIRLRNEIGSYWVHISHQMGERNDVAVKNRWKLLCRRTMGSLFTSEEGPVLDLKKAPGVRLDPPPLPPSFQKIRMPPLRGFEPPVEPTSGQKDLEEFFTSLRPPEFTNRETERSNGL
jgi:hypothetical protein